MLPFFNIFAEPAYPIFPAGVLSNDVKTDVVTPHITWAKPYAEGKVKALFIGPRFGQRETVELQQRFQIEASTILSGEVNQWDWTYPVYVAGSSKDELLQELDKKLDRDLDVIVIGNIDWGLLPKSAAVKIFRHVAEGAGLVVCQFGQARLPSEYLPLLTQENPDFSSLVPLRVFQGLQDADGRAVMEALPAVESFRFRKGRVCLIDYPGTSNTGFHYLTADPNDRTAYDYQQALVGKAVLWASGKAGKDFSITGISAPEIVRDSGEISVSVKDARSNAKKIGCLMTIRNRNGEVLSEQKSEREGKIVSPIAWKIDPLPEGVYFADVTFRKGEEVIDWASTSFRVLTPESIQDVVIARDVVGPGQKVKGQVVTTRPLRKGEEMRVSLVDGWGRTFARFNVPDEKFRDAFPVRRENLLGFEWPVADSLSTVNKVRAEWFSNGRVVSVMEREFYVPRLKDGDFSVGVWGATERFDRTGWLFSALSNHEHALGIDAALMGHVYMNPAKGADDAMALARAGLAPMPYIDRTGYYGTSRERNPCLSDPEYLKRNAADLRSWAWALRKAGCIAYNLGDEPNLSILGVDVCIAPATLAVFHNWLKEQYGSLDALNVEYGSAFKTWDEIVPLTRQEATAKGNMSPWVDHKIFMTKVMADYIGSMQDALRQSDPLARAGCEGIWGTNPSHGFDWMQQVEKAGMMIPYANEKLSLEAVRSFQKPGALTGIWAGGYPQFARFEWKERHAPWSALLHGMSSIWFYDDYNGATQSIPMCLFSHDFTLNRPGAWFLEETQLIKEGVGKLIYQAKRRNDPIALLYSLPSVFLAGNHAEGWIAALGDSGYSYDVIARSHLEAENGLAKFKALVLPRTVSLSDAEVKQIRKFVENGGTVLADGLPGEYDGHGKKRPVNPLQDLFGSKAGRAVLVDFDLDRYENASNTGQKNDLPERLGSLLVKAGLPKRTDIPGMEPASYEIPGGTIHAALMHDTNQKTPAVTIPTDAPTNSYCINLLTGKELKSDVTVTPGRPTIWATLSQKPGPLVATAARVGETNRFAISVQQQKCPFNVVHLTVSDPDGKRVDGYTANLVLRDGHLETECFLGETAAPGNWTAVVRDVLSGQQATIKLEVLKNKP
jgi:hypothetical protein